MRAFIAVARTGSFTLAAESLFVSQSALSGLIKELEQTLGLKVIERSTRRLHLSDVGRDLYPLVDKILHDLDGVLVQVAERKALKTGMVRIATPQLMASTLLPEVIVAYGAEHPEIRIKVVDCVVENVMSRVFSGEVDFGIGPERDPNSDIATATLFEGPFMAVFPHHHPLAALPEVRWTELMTYPFIALKGQFIERLSLELRAVVRDISLAPSSEVAFMSTALAMVSSGLGVTACIPYATSLVSLYGLTMRPLIEPVVKRRFFVFTREGRSLTPAAESFRAFLFHYISEHPNFTH